MAPAPRMAEGIGLQTSIRGRVAVTVAIAAVIVSGVMGALATTAPEDLACDFVGVSTDESGRTYPTAVAAAAAFASVVLHTEPEVLETDGGVVEVPASATTEAHDPGANIFALRDHGRTVGFVAVHPDGGGWAVGQVELC
jgi:broad specificity phosphatase PhoE